MSKAINNLRKLEISAYKQWFAACREVQEYRNKYILADSKDASEKKAMLTFAHVHQEQAYRHWMTICDTLDQIEADNHRPIERP
jgi:hypothetical protein